MRDLPLQLIFIFISITQSAIISHCIRQFIATQPAKNFCLECWDGFYVKQGTCQQCNKYIKTMECSYPKYISNHFEIPSNSISNNMSMPNKSTQSKQGTKQVYTTAVNKNTNTTQIIHINETNGSKAQIKNLPSVSHIINVIINESYNDTKNHAVSHCVVYSQIEDKCKLCDTGYVLISNLCTINTNTNHNIVPNNLAILYLLEKSKKLIQTKTQNSSMISSINQSISNITASNHGILSMSNDGHDIVKLNVTDMSLKESAKTNKKVESVIKIGGQVKIQKIGNNETYVIKNNSERCAEYREQKGKQKTCIRCIQGYIMNRLENHCIAYHNFMEVGTDNMKNLTNINKMQMKLKMKISNQSTTHRDNITYDYNVTSIDVKLVVPATPIPVFSLAQNQSIHVVLPKSNTSNEKATVSVSISDNSSNVHNSTINITALKMKYNLKTTIDAKTNKTILVIGTTTNPPNKIAKCIKYREITYTCVQCQEGYTLVDRKCTDNISISHDNCTKI